MPRLRLLSACLSAALLTCAVALPIAAQTTGNRLPDIGSSAGQVLNPKQQEAYGAMTLSQLRHYGYVLEDPLLEDWLQSVGHRLAANERCAPHADGRNPHGVVGQEIGDGRRVVGRPGVDEPLDQTPGRLAVHGQPP